MTAFQDITNQRFGRLVAVRVVDVVGPDNKYRRSFVWECKCDCGSTKNIRLTNLRNGSTKSCGCLLREGVNFTHRKSKTPTYFSWLGMRRRCKNSNVDSYKHYGGRGITVCQRWESFINFLADMGEKPSGCSIDRIDPNGDYEPNNVRWATNLEQRRNRRDTVTQSKPAG